MLGKHPNDILWGVNQRPTMSGISIKSFIVSLNKNRFYLLLVLKKLFLFIEGLVNSGGSESPDSGFPEDEDDQDWRWQRDQGCHEADQDLGIEFI